MNDVNHENKVHLEGTLTSCRLDAAAGTASLFVATLHPRPGAAPGAPFTEKYEAIRHLVRVDVSPQLRPFFRNADERTRDGGISEMIPCIVDGSLASENGETFVRCPAEGFSRTESLRTSGNNSAVLSGEILSVSSTPESATFSIGCRGQVFESFVPRSVCPKVYADLSGKKIGRGDTVSLSGPLSSRMFSDGSKSVRMAVLMPESVSRIRLSVAETVKPSGPSL